jgi:hypothetical protein
LIGIGDYLEKKTLFGPVTLEEAKQKILRWTGRTNLNIQKLPQEEVPILCDIPLGVSAGGGIKGIHSTAHGLYSSCYCFGVWDPNPDHKYAGYIYVDSFTGNIVHIDRGHEPREGQIEDMIPPQQAINLARQLVVSYFHNIPVDSLQGVETKPEVGSNGNWKEYCDEISVHLYKTITTEKGAVKVDIQQVWVDFDSHTGDMSEIEVAYIPLQIDPVPSLTKEEAAQSLISYLYGLGAEYIEIRGIEEEWQIRRESPNGPQHIFIVFTCWVDWPAGSSVYYKNFWEFAVDGHTGEIVWGYPLEFSEGFPSSLSKRSKISSPRLIFNGREIKANIILKGEKVYLRMEDLKGMGFKIEEGEGGYIISYKNEKAIFPKEELFKKGGELYVERESLSKLKGVMTKYRGDVRELHMWIMNEKAFKKGEEDSKKLGIEKGKEKIKEKVKETPAPIPQKTESSGNSPAILVGGSLFAIGIGYGLLKFLRF